jgi:uncharacterized protein (TIRG00374 family)
VAIGEPSPAAGGHRAWLVLARLGLAAALLAYVLTRIDWSRVAGYGHTVSWPWFAAFLVLIPLGHVISSAKWQMLLRAGGHRVGLWRLTGLYTVGQFYNAVFPSTIGGDVVRSLGLRRLIGDTGAAFASTVAERFTGAAVLVALGGVATLVALPGLMGTREGVIDGRVAALMALAAMGAATLAIVAVLSDRTLALLRRVLPPLEPIQRGLDDLQRFQGALIEYRDRPAVMVRAIAYSMLFYTTTIGLIYAGCRMTGAPGASVGVLDAAVITPIILLIALLPLTPGGYGVVQWGYMVTFAALDIAGAATLGVFVSLMLATCSIGVSAIGYALYTLYNAFEDGRKRPGVDGMIETP